MKTRDNTHLVRPDYHAGYKGHVNPAFPQTVVVSQPASVVTMAPELRPDPTAPFCLACFVTICCCWPLGLAALIIAVVAAQDADVQKAKKHLQVSVIVGVVGLVIGLFCYPILIAYSRRRSEEAANESIPADNV